jgi:hypothetical protein
MSAQLAIGVVYQYIWSVVSSLAICFLSMHASPVLEATAPTRGRRTELAQLYRLVAVFWSVFEEKYTRLTRYSCIHRLLPIRLYLRIHVADVTRLYLVHCLDTCRVICDRYILQL